MSAPIVPVAAPAASRLADWAARSRDDQAARAAAIAPTAVSRSGTDSSDDSDAHSYFSDGSSDSEFGRRATNARDRYAAEERARATAAPAAAVAPAPAAAVVPAHAAAVVPAPAAAVVPNPAVNPSPRICVVCNTREANTRLNCGHLLCSICTATLRTCPLCRAPITSAAQVLTGGYRQKYLKYKAKYLELKNSL